MELVDVRCKKCLGYGIVRIKQQCVCTYEKEKDVLNCVKCNNNGFILILEECEKCAGSGRIDNEWMKSLK
ncbi:unnamed protein product [marine sediment metagenome]|uniref:CR-type domain-containing protein n=1 Tax=marine sediment metagenome TaxID=412755 RepID=X1V3I9_9ZZZZ